MLKILEEVLKDRMVKWGAEWECVVGPVGLILPERMKDAGVPKSVAGAHVPHGARGVPLIDNPETVHAAREEWRLAKARLDKATGAAVRDVSEMIEEETGRKPSGSDKKAVAHLPADILRKAAEIYAEEYLTAERPKAPGAEIRRIGGAMLAERKEREFRLSRLIDCADRADELRRAREGRGDVRTFDRRLQDAMTIYRKLHEGAAEGANRAPREPKAQWVAEWMAASIGRCEYAGRITKAKADEMRDELHRRAGGQVNASPMPSLAAGLAANCFPYAKDDYDDMAA